MKLSELDLRVLRLMALKGGDTGTLANIILKMVEQEGTKQ